MRPGQSWADLAREFAPGGVAVTQVNSSDVGVALVLDRTPLTGILCSDGRVEPRLWEEVMYVEMTTLSAVEPLESLGHQASVYVRVGVHATMVRSGKSCARKSG